jgi:hypothetical protein
MTRARFPLLVLLPLALALTGCVATELKVTNRTGGVIQFYTGHTKKTVSIQDGATVIVPHTVGRILVIARQDEVWQYDVIAVPNVASETTKGHQRLTLPVSIDSSGAITLPSGRKVQPTQTLKPRS